MREVSFWIALDLAAGLPDLVDQMQSRTSELEVDGAELFRLRHIHSSLDQLTHHRVNLRSQLFQDGFNALLPGLAGRRSPVSWRTLRRVLSDSC
jgi:hypothetical protein